MIYIIRFMEPCSVVVFTTTPHAVCRVGDKYYDATMSDRTPDRKMAPLTNITTAFQPAVIVAVEKPTPVVANVGSGAGGGNGGVGGAKGAAAAE